MSVFTTFFRGEPNKKKLLKLLNNCLLSEKRSKYFVLGLGARRTFRLSSRQPKKNLNILYSTGHHKMSDLHILIF